MKSTAWLATAFAFVLIVFWWRHDDLQDEVRELRREIAALHAKAEATSRATPRAADDLAAPSAPGDSASRIGIPAAESEAAAAEERIQDLERVATAQADLIEQLFARFDAEDEQRRKAAARPWGPEQAVGAPDTQSAGDFRTAWAPAAADGGEEWIEATFSQSTEVAQLIVRQTSNPGTITKVVAVLETGAEVPVWSGEDPSRGQKLSDTPFAFPAGMRASRVKVYLDTSRLPGWEEIDALRLVGRDGSQQWARSVNASSTYGGGIRTYDSLQTLGSGDRVNYWDLQAVIGSSHR